MSANSYAMSQEHPHECDKELLSKMEECREYFERSKAELIESMKKLDDYNEITFDKDIQTEILAWEFEDCKTEKEIMNKAQKFSDYMQTLDLIQ